MHKTSIKTLLAIAAIGLFAGNAEANTANMRQLSATAPPVGHLHFCRALPDECQAHGSTAQRVQLTESAFAQMVAVNEAINTQIAPATDDELYRTPEHWTYPANAGDCEDYVLLKRHVLIENGWPPSALLITVVLDEVGQGHAVLTVSTDRGDFILDNNTNEVRLWRDTPYTYLKRQSHAHAGKWVSLEGSLGVGQVFVGQNRR